MYGMPWRILHGVNMHVGVWRIYLHVNPREIIMHVRTWRIILH